jgi:hypothetical protein
MKNALVNFQLAFFPAKYQNNDLFAYPMQNIDKKSSKMLRLPVDSLTEPVNAWEQDHQLRRRNRGAVVKRQERPFVSEFSKK